MGNYPTGYVEGAGSLTHFILCQEFPCVVPELVVGFSILFSLHEVEGDFGGATSEAQALWLS